MGPISPGRLNKTSIGRGKGRKRKKKREDVYLKELKIARNVSKRRNTHIYILHGSDCKEQVTFLITCFPEKAVRRPKVRLESRNRIPIVLSRDIYVNDILDDGATTMNTGRSRETEKEKESEQERETAVR